MGGGRRTEVMVLRGARSKLPRMSCRMKNEATPFTTCTRKSDLIVCSTSDSGEGGRRAFFFCNVGFSTKCLVFFWPLYAGDSLTELMILQFAIMSLHWIGRVKAGPALSFAFPQLHPLSANNFQHIIYLSISFLNCLDI